MNAKYVDVVSHQAAIAYLESVPGAFAADGAGTAHLPPPFPAGGGIDDSRRVVDILYPNELTSV